MSIFLICVCFIIYYFRRYILLFFYKMSIILICVIFFTKCQLFWAMKSGFFEQLLFIFIHINKFTQKKEPKIYQLGFGEKSPMAPCAAWSPMAQFFKFFLAQIQNAVCRHLIRWNVAFYRRKQTKKFPRGTEPATVPPCVSCVGRVPSDTQVPLHASRALRWEWP